MLLTPEQAAKALSVGRTTIYGLLAAGVLASVQIGRCRRIPYASVRSFVEELQTKPTSPPKPTPPADRPRSPRSAKMSMRGVGRNSGRATSSTVEALSLPLAAGDQATDEAEANR